MMRLLCREQSDDIGGPWERIALNEKITKQFFRPIYIIEDNPVVPDGTEIGGLGFVYRREDRALVWGGEE